MAPAEITVELLYSPEARRIDQVHLKLTEGGTVAEALAASSWFDMATFSMPVGIWGRKVALSEPLLPWPERGPERSSPPALPSPWGKAAQGPPPPTRLDQRLDAVALKGPSQSQAGRSLSESACQRGPLSCCNCWQ